MRHALVGVVVLAGLLLPGCSRRQMPPRTNPHYVVGTGYQAGGVWFYPRERFQYDQTGVASIQQVGRGLTQNGEAVDADSMTAAHQTLQLPSIVRITNLENGLQTTVRVNDRGPATPNRIVAVSPKVATLLGFDGAARRVRVEVLEGPSLALREQLGGGPSLTMTAAPRTAVTSESLPPLAGIGQSERRRSGVTRVATNTAETGGESVPDRLPAFVTQVPARPRLLVVRAGSFGQMSYARQVAARLSAIGTRIERESEGRGERYEVLAGPFPTISAADAALDQAMRLGVSDARIRVE